MENEKIVFEIDTFADKSTGSLNVIEYTSKLEIAKKIVDGIYTGEITTDEQKKVARETRATINKIIEALQRKRIDTVTDFVIDFENQMKELVAVFDECQAKLGANIKAYTDAHKVVATTTKTTYKAVIKFTDEKMISKIQDFCVKHNLDLEIK